MSVQVLHGDCLDVMASLSDSSVDACITDLPYGTTACKWDVVIPLEPMWSHLRRVVKPCGAILLFASLPFAATLVTSNLESFRYDWIWEKTHPTGHLNARKAPLRAHENVLVFYYRSPTYNPQKTSGHTRKTAVKRADYTPVYGRQQFSPLSYDSTERYPRSVVTFPSDKQISSLHPTQKPIDLIRYLVRTYTNEDDTVLDFAAGSGTTGVACLLENRRCILIESDQGYVDTIHRRLSTLTAAASAGNTGGE